MTPVHDPNANVADTKLHYRNAYDNWSTAPGRGSPVPNSEAPPFPEICQHPSKPSTSNDTSTQIQDHDLLGTGAQFAHDQPVCCRDRPLHRSLQLNTMLGVRTLQRGTGLSHSLGMSGNAAGAPETGKPTGFGRTISKLSVATVFVVVVLQLSVVEECGLA